MFALGIDSSTQSCSAIVIDTEAGKIIAESSVNFGERLPHLLGRTCGFELHPLLDAHLGHEAADLSVCGPATRFRLPE